MCGYIRSNLDTSIIMKHSLLLFLLIGCGHHLQSSIRPMTGPDGSSNWVGITCYQSQLDCFELAGRACPDGYIVAGQDATIIGTSNSSVASSAYGTSWSVSRSSSINQETMLIRCNATPRHISTINVIMDVACFNDDDCGGANYKCNLPVGSLFTDKGHCIPKQ